MEWSQFKEKQTVWKSIVMISIISKSILSDVLILVMWPKWVHKHLREVAKKVFSWENPDSDIDFLTF